MGDDGWIVFNEFVPDVCRQVSGDLAHRCSDPGPVSQDKTNVTLQKKTCSCKKCFRTDQNRVSWACPTYASEDQS